MNPLEKPTTSEEVLHPKIKNLLDTGPNSNYNFRQFQLAAERFGPSHPHDTMDKVLMDDAMDAWANSEYRQAWQDMVTGDAFKTHPRFKGDYANVTLDDLEEFIRTKRLPN